MAKLDVMVFGTGIDSHGQDLKRTTRRTRCWRNARVFQGGPRSSVSDASWLRDVLFEAAQSCEASRLRRTLGQPSIIGLNKGPMLALVMITRVCGSRNG